MAWRSSQPDEPHPALPQPRPAGPPRADQAGHRRGIHRPARRPRPGSAVPGGGRAGGWRVNPDRPSLLPGRRGAACRGRRRGGIPAVPPPAPLPQSPAELPALVTAVYRAAEGQLPLLRALVTSSVGSQVRRRRRARRLQAIQDTLKQIGAGQDETRRAIAIVSLLASADAAVVLADQYGLTLGEAGQACAEATRAIISHLAQATPGQGTHRQQAPPAPATASPDQGQSTP